MTLPWGAPLLYLWPLLERDHRYTFEVLGGGRALSLPSSLLLGDREVSGSTIDYCSTLASSSGDVGKGLGRMHYCYTTSFLLKEGLAGAPLLHLQLTIKNDKLNKLANILYKNKKISNIFH